MAKSNIKGITIEIGGDTTELHKALSESEKSAKSLQSELRDINYSLKFNPESLVLLAQKAYVLGSEITAVSDKLRILRDSQAQVQEQAERGDIGADQYRAFEREIEKTTNQLNDLKGQLRDNGERITDVAQKTGNATNGSQAYTKAMQAQQNAIEKAKESSDEFGKSTSKLKDDFKKAENGAISFGDILKANVIANLATDIFNRFSSALKSFVSDAMESSANMETQYAKLEQVMKNTMSATDDQIQSIVELAKEQEKLGVVSKETQVTSLAELASFVEKKDSLEKMLPILNDYIAYQYDVNASQEQGRNVATALGKALQGQYDGLAKQGFQLTDNQKRLIKYGDESRRVAVISDIIAESMGDVNAALAQTDAGKMFQANAVINEMKDSVGALAIEVKQAIAAEMMPTFQELSQTIRDFVNNNKEDIKKFASTISSILSFALKNMPLIIAAIMLLGSAIAGLRILAFVDSVGKAVTIIKSWEIATKLQAAATTVATAAQWLWNAAMSANPISLIIIAIGALIAILVILYKNVDGFRDGVNKIFDAIGSFVDGFISAMTQNVKNFSKLISDLVKSVTGIFTGAFRTALNGFRNIWMDLWSSIKQGPEQLISFLKTLPDRVMQIGKDIVLGLWKGIKDAWNNFKENVKNLFTGIVDGIKGMLGIHSPSTVFAEIGKDMAAGLSVGWDKEIKNVQGELNASVSSVGGAGRSAQIAQTVSVGTTIGSQTSYTQVTVAGLAELQEYLDFRDNQRRRGRALNGNG